MSLKKFWENIDDNRREEIRKNKILSWKNENRRIQTSNMVRERYKDKKFKEEFTKKMNEVNKNLEKRKDASTKIKRKWTEKEYRYKMLNRKQKQYSKETIEISKLILKGLFWEKDIKQIGYKRYQYNNALNYLKKQGVNHETIKD